MKSKYYFPHTATVFFLLTVAVALFSWIGSIYGLGKVQSLLSPEGIRWELRHAMGNFVQTPALGIVMMLFLGFGITVHSGVWGTLGRIVKRGKPISRKEKRALILAGCILLVYIIMIICTTFAPWTMLRSVTGSLTNSPFQKGIYYLISFGVGLSGMAFGYASGRFREHFLNRIMADDERSAIPGDPASPSARAVSHVAARFAAKEAAVKALGTGFAEGIGPRDVAVRSLPSGKPELVLSGKAREKADALGVKKLHLTLTHTRDNAAAVVILEG